MWIRLATLLVCGAAAAVPLRAQGPELSVPLGMGTRVGTSGLTLAPRARIDLGRLSLASSAALVGQGASLVVPDAALDGVVSAWERGSFALRFDGALRYDAPADHGVARSAAIGVSAAASRSAIRVEGEARAVRPVGSRDGGRLATGGEAALAAWVDVRGLSFGGALRRRSGHFSFDNPSGIDSATTGLRRCRFVRDPRTGVPRTVCDGIASSLDVGLGARATRGALSLDLWLGRRARAVGPTARDPGSWGSMRMAWQTTPATSLVAELARQPSDVARGIPAQTRAFLGVRLTPFASRGERTLPLEGAVATPARDEGAVTLTVGGVFPDGRELRIHAPGARSVELSGDMTGWRVVAAVRDAAPGSWIVRLPIEPGSYTCNVRVDGGPWTPPVGLPTVDDGFGSRSAVVVIE